MNAVQLLREDHKRVADLFREFEMLGDGSAKKKRTIANKVFSELEAHAVLEEELFYPAFKNEADADGQLLVEESFEDHRMVRALIEELRNLDPDNDEFVAKFEELIESVENHMEQEEDVMFPEAEDLLAEKLEDLGREMEQREAVPH